MKSFLEGQLTSQVHFRASVLNHALIEVQKHFRKRLHFRPSALLHASVQLMRCIWHPLPEVSLICAPIEKIRQIKESERRSGQGFQREVGPLRRRAASNEGKNLVADHKANKGRGSGGAATAKQMHAESQMFFDCQLLQRDIFQT